MRQEDVGAAYSSSSDDDQLGPEQQSDVTKAKAAKASPRPCANLHISSVNWRHRGRGGRPVSCHDSVAYDEAMEQRLYCDHVEE